MKRADIKRCLDASQEMSKALRVKKTNQRQALVINAMGIALAVFQRAMGEFLASCGPAQ